MMSRRPFRFGTEVLRADSGADWADHARRVESWGYDTLLVVDHFAVNFAPFAAMAAAASATTTLRIGSTVLSNDFRHPVVTAKEAATIDVASDGRLEFGLGAGWKKAEYGQAGIPWDAPAVRFSRLREGLTIIRELWGDDPVTFTGEHYAVTSLEGWPKPVQRPHPPVFIGGGGRRMLRWAAREADIIGIIAQSTPAGGLSFGEDTEERLAERVSWIREAAADRAELPELSMLLLAVGVTDDVPSAQEALALKLHMTPAQVARSPYAVFGSELAIAEHLQMLRERFGVSYFTVFPQDTVAFAPIVHMLAGT